MVSTTPQLAHTALAFTAFPASPMGAATAGAGSGNGASCPQLALGTFAMAIVLNTTAATKQGKITGGNDRMAEMKFIWKPVAGSEKARAWFILGLLEPHVVADRGNAAHALRHLDGAVDVGAGTDEATQLDAALEGFYVDLGGLERGLVEDGGLHLGGDGGVVDVLAGALMLAGRSAACQGCEGDGGEKDGNAAELGHVWLSRNLDWQPIDCSLGG